MVACCRVRQGFMAQVTAEVARGAEVDGGRRVVAALGKFLHRPLRPEEDGTHGASPGMVIAVGGVNGRGGGTLFSLESACFSWAW